MDPIVEQAHSSNSDKSILVQIHPSQSGDVFYSSEMTERLAFYQNVGLNFVGYPTLYIDGLGEPPWLYSIANITAAIDSRINQETPITIESEILSDLAKTNDSIVTINYKTTVTSEEVLSIQNLRLVAFIVESGIEYLAPNNTAVHNHVALDIIPDESGIPLDFSDVNNLSKVFEGSVEILLTDELKNHSIVAIVQDFNSGEVYQAIELTYNQYLNSKVENNNSPIDFRINNVFPNPFNPVTNISFSIEKDDQISLQVFNLIGEQVDIIVDNKKYTQGNHVVQWNASEYPTGVYLMKLITENGIDIKRSLLLK